MKKTCLLLFSIGLVSPIGAVIPYPSPHHRTHTPGQAIMLAASSAFIASGVGCFGNALLQAEHGAPSITYTTGTLALTYGLNAIATNVLLDAAQISPDVHTVVKGSSLLVTALALMGMRYNS